MAASVASVLTSGQVYLCGYDMTHGHAVNFAGREAPANTTAMCADGVERPTTALYLRTRSELDTVFCGRSVVQCSPQGLRLEGDKACVGTLPDDLPRRTLDMNALSPGDPALVASLSDKMRSLRKAWPIAVKRAAEVETLAECSAAVLIGKEHADFLSYVLYSLYAQMSIERRLGRGDIVLDWFKEASANVLGQCTGYVMEATADA
jgi:hypothetical protein